MKRIVKRLLCLSAAALLFTAFMSLSAFATLDDARVGEYFQWCVEQSPAGSPEERFSNVVQTSGGCPGLYLSSQSDAVWLMGTPTTAGSFPISYTAFYEDGSTWDNSITVTVAPAEAHPEYISCSADFTAGVFGTVTTADCSSGTQSCTLTSGSLPVGVGYTSYDTYMEFSGTPTTPGSYSAVFYCDTEGEPVYFTINITVNPDTGSTEPETPTPVTAEPSTPTPEASGPVARQITQQPMDVTVEEGKDCQFTANADGKGWCAWRFYKPDGTEVIFDRLNALGTPYNQVTLEGGNGLVFRVGNVPMEMNGWSVCCLFALSDTADGKPWAYTNRVKIHVTAAPTPTPTVEPTVEPVAEAVSVPEAEATDAPAEEPVQTVAPSPELSAASVRSSSSESHTTLLIVLAVLSAGLIGAVVVLLNKLQKMKKK